MYEKKLDYAGLKRVAPSPYDHSEFEMQPMFKKVGKVSVSPRAPEWFVHRLIQNEANPHTVLNIK